MYIVTNFIFFTWLTLATSLVAKTSFNGYRQSLVGNRFRLFASSSDLSTDSASVVSAVEAPSVKGLTQKEYMIAIRNRLFAVEEQIWLHDYATIRGDSSKVNRLSDRKYDELLRARGDLLDEYPLTKLYLDLKQAQEQNLSYAALYLERLIANFKRQIPLSMEHVNQIAVLSFSGQVVNLMRGQGAVYHRLLPSTVLTERGIKRQFQHPSFSSNGQYIAFAELHFKDTGIVRSDALVFEVPKDPKTFGVTDSMPLFDSGDLPGTDSFTDSCSTDSV